MLEEERGRVIAAMESRLRRVEYGMVALLVMSGAQVSSLLGGPGPAQAVQGAVLLFQVVFGA